MGGAEASRGKRDRSSQEQEDESVSRSKKQKTHSSSDSSSNSESGTNSNLPYFQDAFSGRRIDVENAHSVIRRLQENSPAGDPIHKLNMRVKPSGGMYIARLRVPFEANYRKVTSGLRTSPDNAEKRVYYRFCKRLFSAGVLDHRFFPKGSPAADSKGSVDGVASKTSSTTKRYDRKQPLYIVNSFHSLPAIKSSQFFPLVVEVGALDGQPHAPMLILGRAPFPKLFNFKVFNKGGSADVSLRRAAPLCLSEEQLDLLYRYSLRVCRAITNKPLEGSGDNLMYLFAPVAKDWSPTSPADQHRWQLPSIEEYIPWEDVKQAADTWATKLISKQDDITDAVIDDCVLQDRASEFTNRHFAVKLRRDLTPLSRPEAGSRESEFASYLAYIEARTQQIKGLEYPDQPMIEVFAMPGAANNLVATCGSVTAQPKFNLKYLIPEISYRFTIPASTYRTALLLPSITQKLESMLVVKELNANLFDDALSDELLLEAVTCPISGVEPDYQRLELLGDAYLKYLVATYLFATMPRGSEGQMNAALSQLVANKTLRNGALKAGIPPYIQSKPFIMKVWLPYVQRPSIEGESGGLNTSSDAAKGGAETGKGHGGKRKRQLDSQAVQWLGDKVIADTTEAIIGAALLSGGHDLAFRAAKILNIGVPQMNEWSDLTRLVTSSATAAKPPPEIVRSVENITGHRFKQPHLLQEALTHSSLPNASSNYQRLEFLGDAVLDMLVVSYIFDKNPRSTCGQMSLLKSAMVSNQTLGALCILTGLHEGVQHAQSVAFQKAIAGYTKRLGWLKEQEYKCAVAENRLPGQFWLEAEPPKIMSDIIESIVGAIFVSDGFNIKPLRAVFEKLFEPFYNKYIRLQTLSPHPTTTLMELLQAEHCHAHGMRKEAQGGSVRYDVVIHNTVLASGEDKLANTASRKAATAALDALSADPGFVSRICDCKSTQSDKKDQDKTKLGYEEAVDSPVVANASAEGA